MVFRVLDLETNMSLSMRHSLQNTHVMTTGGWALYSGLPGMAFLNFLVGEDRTTSLHRVKCQYTMKWWTKATDISELESLKTVTEHLWLWDQQSNRETSTQITTTNLGWLLSTIAQERAVVAEDLGEWNMKISWPVIEHLRGLPGLRRTLSRHSRNFKLDMSR